MASVLVSRGMKNSLFCRFLKVAPRVRRRRVSYPDSPLATSINASSHHANLLSIFATSTNMLRGKHSEIRALKPSRGIECQFSSESIQFHITAYLTPIWIEDDVDRAISRGEFDLRWSNEDGRDPNFGRNGPSFQGLLMSHIANGTYQKSRAASSIRALLEILDHQWSLFARITMSTTADPNDFQ